MAVWTGRIENDGFNRLVLAAGLSARQTTILRLYCKVLRQAGSPSAKPIWRTRWRPSGDRAPPRAAVRDPLRSRPRRRSFALRRWPRSRRSTTRSTPSQSLDEDRILRAYLTLVAEDRAHQLLPGSALRRAKARSRGQARLQRIDLLPLPRPLYEIYVYSPRVEGVHMRAGKVARGGIRWSDRKEDFRTEILGLMKAQTVKNAVIVPVGSKGGLRRQAAARLAREVRGRGGRMLQDPDPRPPGPDRQHRRGNAGRATGSSRRRRSCGMTATTPISSSPPTRAPRPSPTSPTRSPRNTASGSATPSPRAARPATTTRRWRSPRAAPGSSSSAISASSAATSRRASSAWSGSATCRATCSATACCNRATPGCSPRSTTCTSSSIPSPIRRRALPSGSGCSACRARAGPITTRR